MRGVAYLCNGSGKLQVGAAWLLINSVKKCSDLLSWLGLKNRSEVTDLYRVSSVSFSHEKMSLLVK